MNEPDDERDYTFFHEDGPVTLTETELVNDYMELREAVARYVSCSQQQMRQEKGQGHCPHTVLFGGEQPLSCWALLVNALGKRWQGEAFPSA